MTQLFVVLLPDVLLDDASADPLRYNRRNGGALKKPAVAAVLVNRLPDADLSEYSVITTKDPLTIPGRVSQIVEYVEKRSSRRRWAPISPPWAATCQADIWSELENLEPGAWGCYQLTDAIANLSKKSPVDAHLLSGQSFGLRAQAGLHAGVCHPGDCVTMPRSHFRDAVKKILAK